MDDETRSKLDELKDKSVSGGGNRIQAEAHRGKETFVDTIDVGLDRVEAGTVKKTISFWDPMMAAVLDAFDSDDERRERAAAFLLDEIGRDEDPSEKERQDLIKLSLRYGLEKAQPGVLDDAKEARDRHQDDEPV